MSKYDSYNLMNYEEYSKINNEIKSLLLKNLECKHIANATVENKIWLDLAKKVDYKWVIFGSHRYMPEKERLPFELKRIDEMQKSLNSRPVRIVRVSNFKYFIDNTHWALAFLKRYGLNTKLIDIPFYIVDFTKDIPIVVNINNSVISNNEDIINAVNAAGDVEKRIQSGWRPISLTYTLNDFIEELFKLNIDKAKCNDIINIKEI